MKIIEKHAIFIFTVKKFLVFFLHKKGFFFFTLEIIDLKVLYFCLYSFFSRYYALRQKRLLHKKFIEERERDEKRYENLCLYRDKKEKNGNTKIYIFS